MKTCGSFEWNKSDGICLNCGKPRADHQPTRVIFRKWPKKKGGDVIALFPGLAGTVGDPFTCNSYQTIGQHGAASVFLTRETRKAKPEEYADLKKELERIGYVLTIAHKFTAADLAARKEQLAR